MAKKVVVKKKKTLASTGKKQEKETKREMSKSQKAAQFKPGQSGNPAGRAKGSRNKFAAAFIEDFYADWQDHGVEAVKKVRENDPGAYLRIGASLIPKEFNFNDNSDEAIDRMLDKLDDKQLDELIAGLTAIGRQENTASNTSKDNKAAPRGKPNSIH